MIDREIDIHTKDGAMNTFVTHPEEDGPHPVVMFLMDAPGKREELHDMARRLGSAGYYVMLPNLYYRRLRKFEMESSSREEMVEHMHSLTNTMVCEDIQQLVDCAALDGTAREGKIGCVGYCMSGPFAFAAAAAFPDRIAASASIHGVRLLVDAEDSPHLSAGKIKGEMYFGCAETDEYAPQQMIDDLESHLAGIGIKYRIEMYPGTEHGFVFPLRQGKYHKQSAERHWERLLAMYGRCL
ncbi:MAG: dienelactone hydrolase family protein [Gammaproteobacteria bacterium]|nr:dienelactone hydrolase family protein [Gammaproteobacteria bacterium]MDH3465062.1 dienelactone hydrolase family protein [Gammaproteobacteria bacterium]